MRKLSNSSMIKLMQEVDKCELLCANCHREYHSPDLDMYMVKSLIKNVDDSVLEIKVGKPKCLDCSCEINYTYTRCRKCSDKNKQKVGRPSLEILLNEIKNYSKTWCAKKYGVSITSIRRWIIN